MPINTALRIPGERRLTSRLRSPIRQSSYKNITELSFTYVHSTSTHSMAYVTAELRKTEDEESVSLMTVNVYKTV